MGTQNALSAFLDALSSTLPKDPLDFVIFYHRADLDGRCSNEIARKAIDEEMQKNRPGWGYSLKSVGVDYGDAGLFTDTIERNLMGKRAIVFVLDFTFIDRLDSFAVWPTHKIAERALGLWTIDHHASAIRSFARRPEGRHVGAFIADEKKAGCELTWEFFYPDSPMPRAVHLLGRYDVWDHYHKDIPDFQAGFFFDVSRRPETKPNSFEMLSWRMALSRPVPNDDGWFRWNEWYERVLVNGATINEYRKQESYRSARSAVRVQVKTFAGPLGAYFPPERPLTVLLLNDQRMTSGHFAFDDGEGATKADLYVPFALRDGKWKLSFYRASADSPVDCSRIAETLGGGGHEGAAGANVTELPKWITDSFPPLAK